MSRHERSSGTVKFFDHQRGYGFIRLGGHEASETFSISPTGSRTASPVRTIAFPSRSGLAAMAARAQSVSCVAA